MCYFFQQKKGHLWSPNVSHHLTYKNGACLPCEESTVPQPFVISEFSAFTCLSPVFEHKLHPASFPAGANHLENLPSFNHLSLNLILGHL